MPKYQFVVDYYKDEYRFSPDTNDVKAWSYNTADYTTFNLAVQNGGSFIQLKNALVGLASPCIALIAATLVSF